MQNSLVSSDCEEMPLSHAINSFEFERKGMSRRRKWSESISKFVIVVSYEAIVTCSPILFCALGTALHRVLLCTPAPSRLPPLVDIRSFLFEASPPTLSSTTDAQDQGPWVAATSGAAPGP